MFLREADAHWDPKPGLAVAKAKGSMGVILEPDRGVTCSLDSDPALIKLNGGRIPDTISLYSHPGESQCTRATLRRPRGWG